MSTYDEARTDTHCYHVNVSCVYGTVVDKYYATTRALMKEHKSDGLTMIDVIKVRNGEVVEITIPLGQVLGVAELKFVEYDTLSMDQHSVVT